MRNKTIALLIITAAWGLAVPAAQAQAAASKDSQPATAQDVQLLRQDVRSNKKQLLAANLTLTDPESTKFWPGYDQYAAEMTKIGDQKYAMLKEYAQKFGSLTDAQAQSLLDRSLAVDSAIAQLRVKYAPLSVKCCPALRRPPSSRSTDVSPG